ncbi:hypothetical protein NG2371_07174 [Nocardia gamkensis]|nr:hypothetical protein [Nocardia gamkensis]
MDFAGFGDGADFVGDLGFEVVDEGGGGLGVCGEDDEGDDALAGGGVGGADDGGFGDGVVCDEGGFDFGGGDSVAGDVHDVVDAAEDPEVGVGVEFGAVAGEVPALFGEALPVGFVEALWVAPDAAQHGWPGLVEYEVAVGFGFSVSDGFAFFVDDSCGDAG